MSESINPAASAEVVNTTPEVTTEPSVDIAALQAEIASLKQSNEKLKQAQSNASADASKYKKELQAKMSEEERKAAERAEEEAALRAELAELKKASAVNGFKAEFLKLGYAEELAKSSAESMAENNTTQIFADLAAFITEHDKALNAESIRKTPIPVGGNATPGITPEQFKAMTYTELVKLKQSNPDLYNSLSKK